MTDTKFNVGLNTTTIATSLAVAALIALFSNIWSLNEGQNKTNITLELMAQTLATLAENGKDRYTSTNARDDITDLTDKIEKARKEAAIRVDDMRNDLSSRISSRNSEMKEAAGKLNERITIEIDAVSRRLDELQAESADMSRKVFVIQDRMSGQRSKLDDAEVERFVKRHVPPYPTNNKTQ